MTIYRATWEEAVLVDGTLEMVPFTGQFGTKEFAKDETSFRKQWARRDGREFVALPLDRREYNARRL